MPEAKIGDVVTASSNPEIGECVLASMGLTRPDGTSASDIYCWIIPLDPEFKFEKPIGYGADWLQGYEQEGLEVVRSV